MRRLSLVIALAGCGRIGFATDDAASRSDSAQRDAPIADVAPGSANYVFVTSTTYNGNLGGIAGANAICGTRATAAGKAGTYVALLSATAHNVKDHLGSARGWVRTDGLPFADTQTSLWAGGVFYPIRLDEFGNDVGATESTATYAFTGTLADGTFDSGPGDCNDWASASGAGTGGVTLAGAGEWVTGVSMTCAGPYHLLCFEIDHAVPIVLALQGRIAFVSASPWRPGGGIASADLLCANEATAAALPGTFHALLASSTASAASRFVTTGERWTRVDGVPVFDPASNLAAGVPPPAPLDLTASGMREASTTTATWVFTGANAANAIGTAASTCNDWNSSGGGASATSGLATLAGPESFAQVANPCSATDIHVYCLQD